MDQQPPPVPGVSEVLGMSRPCQRGLSGWWCHPRTTLFQLKWEVDGELCGKMGWKVMGFVRA